MSAPAIARGPAAILGLLPGLSDCDPSTRRRVATAWVLLAGALAAASAAVVIAPSPGAVSALTGDRLVPALALACAALVLTRARLVPRERGIWVWVGAALLCLGGGSMVREVAPAESFSAAGDALYLSFYPLAGLAVLRAVRSDVNRFDRSKWLDALVAALTLATLGAAIAFQAALETTQSATGVPTDLAQAFGDIALLAIVGGMLGLTAWRPGRGWGLLATALGLAAAADAIALHRAADDVAGDAFGLGLIGGVAVIGLAAAAWQKPERQRARPPGWPVVGVPVLSTLAAVGVLVVLGRASDMNTLGVVLAIMTVTAAMARLTFMFRDVGAWAQSQHEAVTDELTGLGNRRLFYRRLKDLLEARSGQEMFAVFLIDLDRFKELNDTLGHHAGDLLLRMVGPRLEHTLRPQDLLARLGGDEFGAVVSIADPGEAAAIAQRMQTALEEPFLIEGLSLRVQASVGISLSPRHGVTADQLLQRADVAMYEAKAGRRPYEFYSSERDTHSRDRLELMTQLRDAIDTGQILLWYQPQANLSTGRVQSVEALVRWDHPERGLLAPDRFVPIAEQTGLIDALTLRVLDIALQQCDRWRRQGLNLSVAVNLSAHHMLDAGLPETVSELLAKWHLPAHRLALEVTENSAMADPERAVRVIARLRQLGVATSIDDYGTGYSSLAYLRRLDVDELKIDRSFINGLAGSPESALIVRSTIDLARNLGLRVIAEGVETPAEWALLAEMGCDSVQGFLLGRPMPADDLPAWIAKWRESHPGGVDVDIAGPALRVVA